MNWKWKLRKYYSKDSSKEILWNIELQSTKSNIIIIVFFLSIWNIYRLQVWKYNHIIIIIIITHQNNLLTMANATKEHFSIKHKWDLEMKLVSVIY